MPWLCLLASLSAAPLAASELPGVAPPPPPRLGACGVAGGFVLPGTDGCLRIDGQVAAEGGWASVSPSLADLSRAPIRAGAGAADLTRSGLGTTGRIGADARLATEHGPVRVYVSVRSRNGFVTDHAAR